MNKAQKVLFDRLQWAEKEIVNAKTHQQMSMWYFGTSDVITYASQVGIIDLQTEQNYEDKLDRAHEEYYRKAKQDLENAHKRLF